MDNCGISAPLLEIRRHLIASGDASRNKLHATTDSLGTRSEVFAHIAAADNTIDVTLLEKSKARSRLRADQPTFYKYAWFHHFRHIGPKRCLPDRKTLITAAALGTKRTKALFKNSVNEVAQQTLPRDRWEVSFLESSQDPCLWVADYCAWAIQRKWERGDTEHYDLIKDKLATEYDLWRAEKVHFY